MELPNSGTMADGNQSDALLLHVGVKIALDVDAHGTCAFVQNSVLRFVVNKSAHGHSLFFTTAEDIIPISFDIPATFSLCNVLQSNFLQQLVQVFVCDSFRLLLLYRIWVD